jgi:hypothetical protein
LVTTQQDGTTRTASYEGCGCAGGDVVTLQDEGTMIGGIRYSGVAEYSSFLMRTVDGGLHWKDNSNGLSQLENDDRNQNSQDSVQSRRTPHNGMVGISQKSSRGIDLVTVQLDCSRTADCGEHWQNVGTARDSLTSRSTSKIWGKRAILGRH